MESSVTTILGWRDYLHVRRDRVRGDAEYFCDRAGEIREQLEFLLANGLNDGAETALGELAEEDMVDFCIMADLANHVDIPDVAPLTHEAARCLEQFFANDPWHSLLADIEINVCLAMLRAYGESEEDTLWHSNDPYLLTAISRALDDCNEEQLGRFVAETDALAEHSDLAWDDELKELMQVCIDRAAGRLRVRHPPHTPTE
jgi:hypothetical protein